jgi:hypothetical protein
MQTAVKSQTSKRRRLLRWRFGLRVATTRELKGFNLATDTVYWPDGQVKQITHSKDGLAIRKLNYVYDVFGNVATQELNNGEAYASSNKLTHHKRTEKRHD